MHDRHPILAGLYLPHSALLRVRCVDVTRFVSRFGRFFSSLIRWRFTFTKEICRLELMSIEAHEVLGWLILMRGHLDLVADGFLEEDIAECPWRLGNK
ncbi:hypothetical protein ACLOJK_028140 [Asimina triloba]